jgi:hypothetical protein
MERGSGTGAKAVIDGRIEHEPSDRHGPPRRRRSDPQGLGWRRLDSSRRRHPLLRPAVSLVIWTAMIEGALTTGASLSINVLQGIRIASLRQQLEVAASRGNLAVGTQVPALEVTDVTGEALRIEPQTAHLPTFIYVFSPTCTWCRRNGPALHELVAAIICLGVSLTAREKN